MIRRLLSWLFGDDQVSTRDALIAYLEERVALRDRVITAQEDYIAELVREAGARAAQEPEPIVLVPQPEDDDEHRLKHYLMCGCELWPNCRHGDA